MLNKYKIELAIAGYWLIHAVNTVRVSRKIGYYPLRLREQAQIFADSQPIPWTDIYVAWAVLAIITVGLCLVLRKVQQKIKGVMIYSAALLLLHAMFRPTDTGGVDYALAGYFAYTFLIAACYGIFVLAKRRFSQ